MKLKDMETKHIIGIAAIVTLIAAAVSVAAVFIAKHCKKSKKYYIDCSDEAAALDAAICDEEAEASEE